MKGFPCFNGGLCGGGGQNIYKKEDEGRVYTDSQNFSRIPSQPARETSAQATSTTQMPVLVGEGISSLFLQFPMFIHLDQKMGHLHDSYNFFFLFVLQFSHPCSLYGTRV